MKHLKNIQEKMEVDEPDYDTDPKIINVEKGRNLNKIQGRMIRLSASGIGFDPKNNNSIVTKQTAIAISEKLDAKEIRDFEKWLSIIESEMLILKNQAKNKRW